MSKDHITLESLSFSWLYIREDSLFIAVSITLRLELVTT